MGTKGNGKKVEATAPRVFVDSSVIIAASISESGASRAIFELAPHSFCKLFITQSIQEEVVRNLLSKAPGGAVINAAQLLTMTHFTILPNPFIREITKFFPIINKKDAHVLAGAAAARADVLVTLDRKDFFTIRVQTAKLPFRILLPSDLLHELRNKNP